MDNTHHTFEWHRPGLGIWSLCLILILTFWFQPVFAQNAPHSQAGTTGAAFLKIGVGARPTALGGAYTAISDDANSMYWNPAGLSRINGTQLSLMHNKWVQDINYEFVGVAVGDSGTAGFAFGLTFLWMGDIAVTTFNDRLGTSGRTFTARDLSFVFAYGHQINDYVSMGGTLKRIRSTIDDISANATAFDLGLLVSLPIQGVTLGATVQNLGNRLKFVQDSDRLPLVYKIGAAYSYQNRLTLAVDLAKPIDNRFRVNAGGEFVLMKTLALRGGYNSSNDLDNGFTGGAGVRIRTISIDYAFVPFGVLGNTHRVSAMFQF